MQPPKVVSHEEWLEARRALMAEEKAFTRERDRLSARRRALPWVRIDKDYRFRGPDGEEGLAELFGGRSQLVVYHFMYAPDWDAGCKSCSFWADSFDGIVEHLEHRDVTMVAVSRAPLETLEAFRARMGWRFKWVSSHGSDFNYDMGVSFTPEQIEAGGGPYNFGTIAFGGPEAPGISVFARDDAGAVYRTYATYGRGLDMMNAAYQYLDLVPKGRDEDALSDTMEWVRLRDSYD